MYETCIQKSLDMLNMCHSMQNSSECIVPMHTDKSLNENLGEILTPTEGAVTCSMILWLLLLGKNRITKNVSSNTEQYFESVKFYTFVTVSATIFGFLLPFLTIFFVVLAAYKFIIKLILQVKYREEFRGFLEGSDVFWAIEENKSRSVINILLNVQVSPELSYQEACSNIRQELIRRVSKSAIQHPKLLYRRRQEYGHTFWIQDFNQNIEGQIRIVPVKNSTTFKSEHIGMLCNCPLPYNHTSQWEILIGCPYIKKSKQSAFQNIHEIQILFRLHHALGDGVALMRYFMEHLVDKDVECRLDSSIYCSRGESARSYAQKINDFVQKSYQGFLYFKRFATLVLLGPIHIIKQVWVRKPDQNVLHGLPFTGKKNVAYYTETDGEKLKKIKSAKKTLGAKRFTEVLLALLSCSIEDFLRKRNSPVPDEMTVIIPSRIAAEGVQLKLHNKFSVALQTIPINSNVNPVCVQKRILSKLSVIKVSHEQLQDSPEYMINFGVLWLLANLLPKALLTPFIISTHCSVAVSNLPGPVKGGKLLGHKIRNIIFWIPNRGTMGIGFSLLSYQDNIQMGLICDQGVISSQKDVQMLLDTLIEKIECLK